MNALVFDIETVPDPVLGRKLLDLDDKLTDKQIIEAMFKNQLEKKGTEFLSLHCHKVVAISVVLANDNQVKVWSIGELGDNEESLISRFFAGVEKIQANISILEWIWF